jgi:cell volume regulation protein A
VLATLPVLAGVRAGHQIFNVVFFVVVLSALIQGTTAGWLARHLSLTRA